MSDTENNLPSPSKTEKSAMETTNNDEAEKIVTKNEIVPNVDSPPPSEPNTPNKSPENTASKKKKRKTALGYVSDSDEELPMGLLERPFIIESGKRERKKTDRLPVGEGFGSGQKKKKIDVAEGKGEKLRNIAIIEFKINQHKTEDLKFFHRFLFSRVASIKNFEIKKNIRLFNGFPFEVDDKEYTKRMAFLNKSTLPQIKQMCAVLDLEKKGTKLEIVNRLMNFLMKPTDSGKEVPTPKKRKSRPSGEKRKRTKNESKKEDASDEKDDDDDDVKDTTLADDESSQEDKVDGDESESEKEAAKPPKKKRRTESPKPQKSKSEKPKAEKTKAEKPKPKPKKEKKEKENGKKEKSKGAKVTSKGAKVTKGSDDSSDDEPLSKSISDPPGNDEIKKIIEKILDGADLEEVTMKTVVKQVYAKYPKFDLSDKKEFIKCTVKEIISFND